MSDSDGARALAQSMTGVIGKDLGIVTGPPAVGNRGDYARDIVHRTIYIFTDDGTATGVGKQETDVDNFEPVGLVAASRPRGLVPTLAAALPNATLNTNGTAVPVVLAANMTEISAVSAIVLTYATVGVETVTSTITATYNSGGTITISDNKAISGANTISAANLLTLIQNGRYITGLSVMCQSSINSSTATVTMAVTATQAG